MILLMTYEAAMKNFNFEFDKTSKINKDDLVVVKVLDLLFAEKLCSSHYEEVDDPQIEKSENWKKLRSKLETELLAYKGLWKYNRFHQLTEPKRCINAPQLIHYGEITEDQKKSFKVNFTETHVDETNYPDGHCHFAGPFIIFEYLQNMKHPDQEEELNAVKSMRSSMDHIDVEYRADEDETPDENCFYDLKNKKAYLIDFETCLVSLSQLSDEFGPLDLSVVMKRQENVLKRSMQLRNYEADIQASQSKESGKVV
ncbi:unnamed protein product [Ambrosiozyma monospora]|uniref:Unnamed protein product n=1 Tax=Ambrosiozyma monospora TaxID=43982 RepID=A0ACB5SYF9_AMBMO|nr:unnamed protein product [Ambrosiozyma monospora]